MIICHSIPGRLRIKSIELRGSHAIARHLENRLLKMNGILSVQARVSTGSIILVYDVEILDPDQFPDFALRDLEKIFREDRKKIRLEDKTERQSLIEFRSDWSLGYLLINTLFVGGFLGYALIRRYVLKSPLSENVWGLTGLVTGLGGLPLLGGTVHEIGQKKRPGLLSFLAIGCVSAILAGELFTALEIVWLLSFGMFLEEYVKKQAYRAIRDIMPGTPRKTTVLISGAEKEIDISELKVKSLVVVRTGEWIPADGTIFKGKASIDEAHITGRAFPELRQKNDFVYAGTRVQEGAVYIRTRNVGQDTYLAQMTHLVEASLAEQTESQRKADVLADRLIKFGWASTLVTLIFTGNPARAVAVMLVMSCPCATVLAASTAVSAGIANAARRKIIIKGGDYLEQLKDIETVCFDKTGTITRDTPQVVEIVPRNSRVKSKTLLAMAASIEAESNHPIAKALTKYARERNVKITKPKASEIFLGRGVRAIINSDKVWIGNPKFLKSEGIDSGFSKNQVNRHMAAGRTAIYIAKNHAVEGIIVVANAVRSEVAQVLDWLRSNGIRNLYLISGDSESSVKLIAQEQHFDDFKFELLPEAKAQFIEQLKNEGRLVMMVGDGINDALALSRATIGVAMGAGGSEVALETADIALADSDLRRLMTLRRLSQQTHRIVEMNFWLATASNIVGVILGFAGRFSPVMAGIFHVGHTVGIMANSSRLLNWEDSDTEFRRS
jgi:cation-transporting P-type ATPase C